MAAFTPPPVCNPPAHIILCNEAADLDSIACAVSLSHTTPNSTPVINIPRSKLHLRRDALHALKLAHISHTQLCFIDDPWFTHVSTRPDMRVTLVDHNSLADTQLHLGKFVTGIVDHHHDDGLFVQANPRVVERVGSCATLVTEMCCVKGDMDRDIAMLLLCAILIDCNNLSEGGKATVRDREQAHMLCCLLCMSEKERDELYAKLKFLRRDMEGFSVRDLLERDTKKVSTEAVRIAVASVPLSSESLAGRAGGWERLGEEVGMYAREEEVDCMVLMCGYSDDGVHRRDLLVCNGMGDIARKVAADLERREELKLDCVEGDWGMLRYWQRNVKASRKVVLPALRDVVRELR